ncbi:hypothetical protein Tco_1566030, partial [Tanacetum coccineum]
MRDNEKDLQDELEMLVTQEFVAKAMDDVSRQAFFLFLTNYFRISMDLRMDRSWAANSSYSWYSILLPRHMSELQLADATGIHNLSDAKVYAGLATL